jgi:hypothetical protein
MTLVASVWFQETQGLCQNMTKHLKGICQHCGALMHFPAEQAGETASCPQCGQETALLLAPPPEEKSPLKARAIIFISIALVILVGGVVGAQIAIKRAKRMTGQDANPVATKKAAQPSDPIAQAGFQVSPVLLQKATNSTLVYAVGTVTELANRKRFGVRVELALFDREGKPCGAAKDYAATLDASGSWQFRAMVINPQAARAAITSVGEDK